MLYDVLIRHRENIIEWPLNHRPAAEIYWSEGFRLLRSDNPADNHAGRAILAECWRVNDPEAMRTEIQQIKEEVSR